MFDTDVPPDELRSWPTERLDAYREHLARERRRLQIEKVELLRILDERGRLDTAVTVDRESPPAA